MEISVLLWFYSVSFKFPFPFFTRIIVATKVQRGHLVSSQRMCPAEPQESPAPRPSNCFWTYVWTALWKAICIGVFLIIQLTCPISISDCGTFPCLSGWKCSFGIHFCIWYFASDISHLCIFAHFSKGMHFHHWWNSFCLCFIKHRASEWSAFAFRFVYIYCLWGWERIKLCLAAWKGMRFWVLN